MEYNRLVMKYKNLSEDEKNAILIYKSRLSYCINEITSIPNFKMYPLSRTNFNF